MPPKGLAAFFRIAANSIKKHFFSIGLCFIGAISCIGCCDKEKTHTESSDQHNLYLNITVSENEANRNRKDKQIKFLTSFFKTDWIYEDYKKFLLTKNDSTENKNPFQYLEYSLKNRYANHKPTLLFLEKVSEDRTIAKVAFQKPVGYGFSSLAFIYNFMIVKEKNTYKITSPFQYNTREWVEEKFGHIKYFAEPNYNFNEDVIDKMIAFNRKLAIYFYVNKMEFSYYICKNYDHIMEITGYDLAEGMFREYTKNSLADSYFNRIYSGRYSEYHPHELVHLYQARYFPYAHPIIIEGIATYLGGVPPLDYKEYIQVVNNHLKGNRIDFYKELFENKQGSYVINNLVSLKYAVGALLCDLTVKQCGKQGLFKLLDSGRTDEDLLLTLNKLFGIDKSEFNGFIEKQLQNYK